MSRIRGRNATKTGECFAFYPDGAINLDLSKKEGIKWPK